MTSKSGTTNETYGMTRLAATTESNTSFFLNDGRGSVVQTTNAQGATTSWKSYSAFGQIESSSDLGELPSYGYNAEEQHPTTGLTYLRFRYYEASTSTFGVQDTYLGNIFSPLTLNRYLYCLGNPVNYVDPTGHVSVGSLLTGGIVGTITTAIANIKVTILEVIRPHADKIFGKGSRAKIDRDIALAKAARDRVIKFYCGQAERIAASKKSQAGFYANLERFANDYWYVPIASDIAEVGVSSNNGDIPKTIFNLGMLVAGVTPAKAIKGTSKLSPIIAKLFGMDKAEDAVKAADKATGAIKGSKTVDDIIDEAMRLEGKSSKLKQYEKAGTYEDALRDFNSLNLKNVKRYDDKTFVGYLDNGDTVIVRNRSSYESPTLEIQTGSNKTKRTKIRYV